MATTEVAILGQTSGFTLNNMKMIQHWLIQWLYALLVIQSTCVYSQDYGYDSKVKVYGPLTQWYAFLTTYYTLI